MSELCLKAFYMGYNIKEIKVNYFQRETKSRATSLYKIPGMIASFLNKFSQLKITLNEIKKKNN